MVSVKTNITIPDELWEWAKGQATSERKTLSAVIEASVRHYRRCKIPLSAGTGTKAITLHLEGRPRYSDTENSIDGLGGPDAVECETCGQMVSGVHTCTPKKVEPTSFDTPLGAKTRRRVSSKVLPRKV